MISRESQDENRAKVKEHRLTFPVLLQKQWEVSRAYAYFATPVACIIDVAGTVAADVAVGVDAVVDLIGRAEWMLRQETRRRRRPFPNAWQIVERCGGVANILVRLMVCVRKWRATR
jgi:hypothetical protein